MEHGEEDVQDSRFDRHVDELFVPFKFPPELTKHLPTYGNYNRALLDGRNSRLSFLGTSPPLSNK